MDDVIRRSLEYIEAHLDAEITPADLAHQAGYSPWHFTRLFAQATGQPVGQYVLRRRLERVLAEVAAGRRAIDAALTYGFETYSGFYRAFVKLYGCSPKRYLRIYGGYAMTRGAITMKHYTKTELRRVLEHWGMEKAEIGDMPVMYDGRPDDSAWLVGGEYRLRTGDRVRCLRDLRVAQALTAHGVTADVPVPTLDGREYLDGESVFLLSRMMPGEQATADALYGEGRLARALGEGIARLHGALKDIEEEVPHDRGDLHGEVLGWALPAVRKQDEQWSMGLGEAFFADWQERFGSLYPRLPRGLIHRNPCPGYVLMRDGQVAGFKQFDMLENEARLFDLCYAATAILSETAEESRYPAWLNVLEEILRGYDGVSPLTDEEKRAVFGMLCGIQMTCVAYFGERDEQFRELARRNRAMLVFIAGQRERVERMLAK